MNPQVKAAYRAAVSDYRAAHQRGELDRAFVALERAHILGQRYLIAHIAVHLRMLRIGLARRDARELFGQVLRLVATIPGYLSGWVPKGNPGGAKVSAIRPMPLAADLEPLLRDFNVWRSVAKRVAIYALIAATGLGVLAVHELRRAAAAAALEKEWEQRAVHRVGPLPATAFVEILPVVNWRAAPGLKSEPGVAYLIRTDRYTVLFDVGFNRAGESPSPLEHNLAALGVGLDEIDAIFLSHAHRDHVGGTDFERTRTFSLGLEQRPLPSSMRVLTPVAMHYPGTPLETATGPAPWIEGLATTGPIPRQLVLGRIDEQALLINVAGRGLVAIVGCGHQTLPKLLAHVEASFTEPLIGMVGDLHYPVPEGRLFVAGIDAQRRLASGTGLWQPMDFEQAAGEIDMLESTLDFLGLGSHDTSDAVHDHAEGVWGDRFYRVVAGEARCVTADSGTAPLPSICPSGAQAQ